MRFEILPLEFDAFDTALAQQRVDFIILNPAFYIEMEHRHGVSRIATLQNRDFQNRSHTRFGSAIFVREKSPINTLADLRHQRVSAVHPHSLGGWLMGLKRLKESGINESDLILSFEGTHDQVVWRVLSGQADAGGVRSDTLERMAASGVIELSQLRVLEPLAIEGFAFRSSTPLLPEWPFAQAKHTPATLAEKVAIALIRIDSHHPANRAAQIGGWTIPLDYQPVHDLMRTLKRGPYSHLAEPTLLELLRRHWVATTLALIALAALGYAAVERTRQNRLLTRRVEERTRELHHSQAEIASIAESMGEGLLAFEPDGTLLLANPAAMAILGLSRQAIAAHLNHAGFPFDQIRTHLNNGIQGRYSGQWRAHDETAHQLRLILTPLNGPWGRCGVVAVFEDITEEHEAKDRLTQLNRTLEAKVSEKIEEIRTKERLLSEQARLVAMAEMMSAIAHHWRQPINNVAVLAQDLSEAEAYGELDRAYLQQGVKKIMQELHALSATIDRFGRFFLPDTHAAPFRAKAAIEETCALVGTQFDQLEIALTCHIPDTLSHMEIMGYAGEFQQALLNLLLNAKDAILARREQLQGRHPGEITLTLSRERQMLLIRICDNGTGIDPEVRDRLFDPYFTTKRRTEGAGVGLYMVKMLVEKSMHGQIAPMTEKAGQGACLGIWLPLFNDRGDRGS